LLTSELSKAVNCALEVAAREATQDFEIPFTQEYTEAYFFLNTGLSRRISRTTAGAWWRYSFFCVRRLKGKHLWVEFFLAFQKRKEYIPLYKRHAHAETSLWMTPLSRRQEKQRLNEIEADRLVSMDGLMAWRSIADAQADLEEVSKVTGRRKRLLVTYRRSSETVAVELLMTMTSLQ
jgi:hypothetical protein